MADCTPPTPTSPDCFALLLQLASRQLAHIDRQQATIETLLSRQTSIPSSPSGTPWRHVKAWVERAEVASRAVRLASQAWRAWRMVSWPVSVAFWSAVAGKWLGVL
jgi:hypothetical protein